MGNILKKNPNPIHVPCHRIVKSNGKLGGYMYGSQ
ncbi:MAG: MGMT family protein [Nitrososphaeraceae archaeon]